MSTSKAVVMATLALNEGSTLANSPFANYCDADGNLAVHPMGEKNTYNMGYNYDFNHQYEQLEKGYYVLNSIFTAKLKLPFNITIHSMLLRASSGSTTAGSSHPTPDWDAVSHGANRNTASKFDWSINNTCHGTILSLKNTMSC